MFSLLAGAAEEKRLGALQMQVIEWAPFDRLGSMYDVGETDAGVWIWDAAAAEQACLDAGIAVGKATVVPETALQERGDGLRLVRCLDGVEGQAWEGGHLIASRWWSAPPTEAAWALFARTIRRSSPEDLRAPDLVDPTWIERPWPRAGARRLGSQEYSRIAVAAVVALALVPAFDLGRLAHLSTEMRAAEAALIGRRTETGPNETARRSALAASTRVEALKALDPYGPQIELLAKVAEIMPRNGTVLQEWTYQGEDLRLVVVHPAQPPEAPYFVRALEGVNRFRQIAIESTGDARRLTIRMKVNRR